jgi:hypothetical protein
MAGLSRLVGHHRPATSRHLGDSFFGLADDHCLQAGPQGTSPPWGASICFCEADNWSSRRCRRMCTSPCWEPLLGMPPITLMVGPQRDLRRICPFFYRWDEWTMCMFSTLNVFELINLTRWYPMHWCRNFLNKILRCNVKVGTRKWLHDNILL